MAQEAVRLRAVPWRRGESENFEHVVSGALSLGAEEKIMKLREKINADLPAAMKAKDALRLSVLRMMKSAVKNKEIELIAHDYRRMGWKEAVGSSGSARAIADIGYKGCIMLELTDQPSEDRRAVGVREEMRKWAGRAGFMEGVDFICVS